MFGIGIPELVLILIVGLVVFGPGKLPEVGRAVGKGLREFRKASSALQEAINAPDPPNPQQQTSTAAQSAPLSHPSAPVEQTPAPTEHPSVQAAQSPAVAQSSAPAGQPMQQGEHQEGVQAQQSATAPPYIPPTQESVRQQIESMQDKA